MGSKSPEDETCVAEEIQSLEAAEIIRMGAAAKTRQEEFVIETEDSVSQQISFELMNAKNICSTVEVHYS